MGSVIPITKIGLFNDSLIFKIGIPTYISGKTISILTWCPDLQHQTDGLVQERCNSIANALELCLSCTKPSKQAHYNDIIMSAIASLITSLTIVYSTVCSGADQRKHQSSASLAFVRGIHRWLGKFLHKGPVTRKMFPFDDIIMLLWLPSMSKEISQPRWPKAVYHKHNQNIIIISSTTHVLVL